MAYKDYIKLATHHGTSMPGGFRVRIGAVYGRVSNRLFVCSDYSGLSAGTITAHVSKDGGCNWTKLSVTSPDRIFRTITEFINQLGYVPKVGGFRPPTTGARSLAPHDRNPQRDYMYKNYMARRTLATNNADNADFGGGGDAVMAHDIVNHMKVTPTDCKCHTESVRTFNVRVKKSGQKRYRRDCTITEKTVDGVSYIEVI